MLYTDFAVWVIDHSSFLKKYKWLVIVEEFVTVKDVLYAIYICMIIAVTTATIVMWCCDDIIPIYVYLTVCCESDCTCEALGEFLSRSAMLDSLLIHVRHVNSSPPWTNARHFPDSIFKCQGSTLSFLVGCPKSHFLGWYRNFLVYWYLKLDNQVVNSTCPKDKLGWIWRAERTTLSVEPWMHVHEWKVLYFD